MDQKLMKNRQGLTEPEFLAQYDISRYERPSVTVDMLIFTVMDEAKENYRKLPQKSLKLLLIKRGDHPYLGQWALPGGFVGIDENIDDAAIRELREETNIDNLYMEQLYTWGAVNRDPRTRIISCSYMALADSASLDIQAGDDADDAKWFDVRTRVVQEKKTLQDGAMVREKWIELLLCCASECLQATVCVTETRINRVTRVKREVVAVDKIAFDHAKIIEYAVERLKNKIAYTDIAFNLLPEEFTLSELQQVYEVILGKELLAAAFRRKLAHWVQETGRYTKDAGHRPSKLYRVNSWEQKEDDSPAQDA